MSTQQSARLKLAGFITKGYTAWLVLLCTVCASVHGAESVRMTYYLYTADFIASMIEIPTSPIGGSIIASSYLAGRAPLYTGNDIKVGVCSASFLSMETADGIFTDISNYIWTPTGLIVTWFTPTTPIDLELDSLVNGMVTECTVTVTTQIGTSPFFGKTFNLIVSSDNAKIYFQFTRIGTIF